MKSHPFDVLPLDQGGSLLFTPCPGTKGLDLQTSILQLKQAGASAVVSLTPDDEMSRLEVEHLPSVCAEHGLQWFHFPIEDDAEPGVDFQQEWDRQKEQVKSILKQNGALAIHCRGGSGRTGLMAAILLSELGISHDKAVSMVKNLRPKALQLKPHMDYLAQVYGSRKLR